MVAFEATVLVDGAIGLDPVLTGPVYEKRIVRIDDDAFVGAAPAVAIQEVSEHARSLARRSDGALARNGPKPGHAREDENDENDTANDSHYES
jgi:hypothetical protein